MQLDVEKSGDIAVVTLQAEHLDASAADEFKRDMIPSSGREHQSGARHESTSVRG
jgi:hypothetical protein